MIDAIAVVGPTASGKTELSLKLAEKLNTEIISADSMQFYQGMEIGTSAPSPQERKKVPHHFVAFVPPDFEMNAGYYQDIARKEIQRIQSYGKIPIIVGGSGLYISAVTDGLFEGPGKNEEIRKKIKLEIETYGIENVYQKLLSIDPHYAKKLTSKNDIVRIVRALEVYELTGKPYSEWHKEHKEKAEPLSVLFVAINWDRNILYERINLRVHEMIKSGWIEEVIELIEKGYEKDIYRLKALGYRELIEFIRGNQSLEQAIENIKLHHRHYARRQIIWFRSDKRVKWFNASTSNDLENIVNEIIREIESCELTVNIKEKDKCFLFRLMK